MAASTPPTTKQSPSELITELFGHKGHGAHDDEFLVCGWQDAWGHAVDRPHEWRAFVDSLANDPSSLPTKAALEKMWKQSKVFAGQRSHRHAERSKRERGIEHRLEDGDGGIVKHVVAPVTTKHVESSNAKLPFHGPENPSLSDDAVSNEEGQSDDHRGGDGDGDDDDDDDEGQRPRSAHIKRDEHAARARQGPLRTPVSTSSPQQTRQA